MAYREHATDREHRIRTHRTCEPYGQAYREHTGPGPLTVKQRSLTWLTVYILTVNTAYGQVNMAYREHTGPLTEHGLP